MMKSIKAIFAQDREAYRIPRRVQDTIPIKRVWPDGIFLVGNKYSMSFRFTDINYLIASREDKERMFLTYSELLNSLDSGATTKITLNNHRLNRRDFEASNGRVVYSLDFEVTPHQLRHTYITNLIHAGVDPKTVQYLAGHENSKITMDIYAKVKYNRPTDVAPILSDVFSQWNKTG